jgi:uncharacterized protein (TIRG00374 family)
MQQSKMKFLRLLGFGVGALFLVLAFSQIQWGAFTAALTSVRPQWVIVAALCMSLSMFLRALRWSLITGLPQQDLMKVWEATCIGYLGIIYPARAGEVLRMLRLKQLTGMGGGLAIGSAVIDRIVEGLALCSLLFVVAVTWHAGLVGERGLFGLAYVFLVLAAAVVVFIVSGHRLRIVFQWLERKGGLGARLSRWYEESLAGLQILRSPKKVALTLFVQFVISVLDLCVCWFLFNAFGWDLSFSSSLIVLLYLAAAVSLPSTPGYVGVYQIASLYALRPAGIEGASAVAYGTVLQVITLTLFTGAGVWAVLRQRSRIRMLAVGDVK